MDRTSSDVLAFFSPFFEEEEQSVVTFMEAEVWVDASPFLGKWVHPARSEQSVEQQARFLQVIALNTATLLGQFSQVVLPNFLQSFAFVRLPS